MQKDEFAQQFIRCLIKSTNFNQYFQMFQYMYTYIFLFEMSLHNTKEFNLHIIINNININK